MCKSVEFKHQQLPSPNQRPITAYQAMDNKTSVRYHRLQDIANRSLKESTRNLTLLQLKECYPSIAATAKGQQTLEKALTQFSEVWHRTAEREFKAIFEERDIEQKLVGLEEIIEKSQRRKESFSSATDSHENGPVHLDKLTPKQIAEANVKSLKLARLRALKQELADLRAENSGLESDLKSRDGDSSSLDDDLSSSVDRLEQTANNGDQIPTRSDISQLASLAYPSRPISSSSDVQP